MYHTIGAKYEATRDMEDSELVALIKNDLKEQLSKEYKVLAHKEVYAGGWSIYFTIKNTGIEKYVDHHRTPEYQELFLKVCDIVDSYNFDDSDTMSDYHHVRFYSHIRIEK